MFTQEYAHKNDLINSVTAQKRVLFAVIGSNVL
jgi:hypothetical protein